GGRRAPRRDAGPGGRRGCRAARRAGDRIRTRRIRHDRRSSTMTWTADAARYDTMQFRRAGASGLQLPALTLGLWHNFGDDVPLERQRGIVTTAFDRGITHFDLANNYGPPYGAAEANFGRIMASDLAAHRDEILVTTKAGWDMWPGPY